VSELRPSTAPQISGLIRLPFGDLRVPSLWVDTNDGFRLYGRHVAVLYLHVDTLLYLRVQVHGKVGVLTSRIRFPPTDSL
jgi:hypothetical protein